jgi:hypothetical protein
MSHLKFNVDLVRALMKKGKTFYSTGNNNGTGFYIKHQEVALFYIMDRNIKDKKVVCVVCGVYDESELAFSY